MSLSCAILIIIRFWHHTGILPSSPRDSLISLVVWRVRLCRQKSSELATESRTFVRLCQFDLVASACRALRVVGGGVWCSRIVWCSTPVRAYCVAASAVARPWPRTRANVSAYPTASRAPQTMSESTTVYLLSVMYRLQLLNDWLLAITSAKEVMFSSAFVCLLAGLRGNYWTDFHKTRRKCGTWTAEEAVKCWCYCWSRYVTVRVSK